MKLSISKNKLKINFKLKEKILSLKGIIEIPLKNIKKVHTEPPKLGLAMRVGTHFPGLIRAGTFYTRRGKEFWYFTRGKKFLVIELKNDAYKRIILGLEKNRFWKKEIDEKL